MSQTSYPRRQLWQIRQTFEPNLLSPIHFAEAYEQIVPIYAKILSQRHRELNARPESGETSLLYKRSAA